MNTVWAIREICTGGIEALFDRERSYRKLLELSDNAEEAALFAELIYGRARGTIIELIHDAYDYKAYAEKAQSQLVAGGMSYADATRATRIFYEAFGFPGYRYTDESKVDTIVTDDGRFRTEYRGEVRGGKEHGVGARTCYFDGNFCNYDECVWVDGVMCGYDDAKEVTFEVFEDHKIGFVANDYMIGKTKVFPSGDEAFYDNGKTLKFD